MPVTGDAQSSDALPFPGARRLRTDDWPEHSRTAMFHQHFGRDRVRVEPLPGQPLRIDATIAKFPGLGLVWGRRSPLRSDFLDGNDRLIFSLASAAVANQFGREVELGAGDAIALSGADQAAFVTLGSGAIVTVEFPAASLAGLLGDPAKDCLRRIARDEPALRLLRTYLRSVLATGGKATAPIHSLAISHIRDLAALCAGASRQTGEAARVSGIPAARLQAIKDDILSRLEDDISLDDVAARQSVSPRYVRMLFEREGTTFSEFVRDQRLIRARRLLLSAHAIAISEIAYAVGFKDLSYFNRSFRQRFGCSPREMREGSARPGDVAPHPAT